MKVFYSSSFFGEFLVLIYSHTEISTDFYPWVPAVHFALSSPFELSQRVFKSDSNVRLLTVLERSCQALNLNTIVTLNGSKEITLICLKKWSDFLKWFEFVTLRFQTWKTFEIFWKFFWNFISKNILENALGNINPFER